MALLTFETSGSGGVTHVRITGELDLRGSAVLDPELKRIANETQTPVVALDLRGLDFLDSSGLRTVLVADARLRSEGRRLVLIRGSETVQRVFSATRMEERLEFVDDDSQLTREGRP
jgi:anti-sigma B factor antagonist